jgi:hypothetical protein
MGPTAFRTVEVPDCEQEYHFDIEVGLRAEHRKQLEEVLEGQPASAIITENISDTARKWVEQQFVNVSEILYTSLKAPFWWKSSRYVFGGARTVGSGGSSCA